MTAKILKFRTKESPSREQALRWLIFNKIDFPRSLPEEIGVDLFNGWRFIKGLDGNIYFADCISPGIREADIFLELIHGCYD